MRTPTLTDGIRRAVRDARLALTPGLAEREMRAVTLSAAMTAQALADALRHFDCDPAEAKRQRHRAELLVAELRALEGLSEEARHQANLETKTTRSLA